MDTIFDEQFKEIKGLKWLPWVGKRYLELNESNKLLIVGESHYQDKTDDSIEKHKKIEFTRDVVIDLAINRNYGTTKIFQNLHMALFRNDKFKSSEFWDLISFYNFIQEPMKIMDTGWERPNNKNINDSWEVFFQLVSIMKPQACLFIGTGSADFIRQAILNSDYRIKDKLFLDPKIGKAYPKFTTIVDKEGKETKIIFIRHTSQWFSWSKWHDYLKVKISNELTWFEQTIANL